MRPGPAEARGGEDPKPAGGSGADDAFIGAAGATEPSRLAAGGEWAELIEFSQSYLGLLGQAPYAIRHGEEEKSYLTLDQLAEAIFDRGRKGLTIQRFKGLGEMNPTQLWETTMDPQKRTLLQVRVQDSVEADQTFATLMGDSVEARRDFIHEHALEVRNLDI